MANDQDIFTKEQARELAELRIKSAKLELEDLQMKVENERARRAQIARAHVQSQMVLDQANRDIAAGQTLCRHKKGGKNLEGILQGNSPMYSVNRITYPWGEVRVMCTRCSKEWKKPQPELKRSDPEKYELEMKEYKAALLFDTDNEPCGNVMFTIERQQPPQRIAISE